jgi:hypothetical protein
LTGTANPFARQALDDTEQAIIVLGEVGRLLGRSAAALAEYAEAAGFAIGRQRPLPYAPYRGADQVAMLPADPATVHSPGDGRDDEAEHGN